jgi:hypothetical protein
MITKEITKRFWGLFVITIYSEQRGKGEMYKHFVNICFLKRYGPRIINFTWRTGEGNEYPIMKF